MDPEYPRPATGRRASSVPPPRHGRAAFIHSAALESFSYPPGSPFSLERAAQTRAILASMGLLDGWASNEVAPDAATRAELTTFHDPVYLDAMLAAQDGTLHPRILEMGLGSSDCPIFKGMYDYAALAAGASLTAARLILGGRADVAFNPSGGFHHAGPGYASGFCYVNDIVLACLELTKAGRRVATLDIDVHHGDGTQNAFYDRSDVLTISLHESGEFLFPGTGFVDEIGEGDGRGYCVNMPFPPKTCDEPYLRAFSEVVIPLLAAYAPDVIVLEVGMDALGGDPLAHLDLTNNAHAHVVDRVMQLGRPVLMTGGGGYQVRNTARGWALAWSVAIGIDSGDVAIAGLGGVMLENTDWAAGLRDRSFIPAPSTRDAVDAQVRKTIESVKKLVFPFHGI